MNVGLVIDQSANLNSREVATARYADMSAAIRGISLCSKSRAAAIRPLVASYDGAWTASAIKLFVSSRSRTKALPGSDSWYGDRIMIAI